MAILTADVFSDRQHGSLLNIYHVGGKAIQVQPPVRPYLYSTRPLQEGTMERRKFLSDMQYHDVWKQSFFDDYERDQNRSPFTIEDRFPLKMSVAVDCGYKFVSQYPKILAWDIETELAGLSPNWQQDKVKSIACWSETKESHKFFHGEESKVITDWFAYLHKYDPDILCDFYGRFYDVPTVMQRCMALRLECAFGRDGSAPFIVTKEFEKMGKGKIENTVRIRGRVHFDVHKEVDADYTLTLAGLKNRGLKEVARHYKLNPIEIDYDTMDQLTLQELADYNLSDARCTYEIGQIYFRPLWELAEYLNFPVDMVVQRSPAHVSNVALGRRFHERGIVSDMPNCQRFPQIFHPGKKAIQGAEPRSYRSGVYTEKVKHKDFAGMYVSIMRALNLSTETVSLVSIKPYTGKYDFKPFKDGCVVEVPDTKNGQVTIKIDLSQKGIQTEILDDTVAKRNLAKAEWKKTKDPALWSKQIMLKLIGNASFGYNTMAYATYGSILVGELDCAIARLLLDKSIALEEKAGNIMLESDTDGYFYVENVKTDLNVADCLPDCFDLSLIQQEVEDVQGIILLDDISQNPAAKSYMLKDGAGKITKHGSSILGRHIPLIIDVFIDELGICLFNREDTYSMLRSWSKRRILKFPLKAFTSQATFSKRPESYNSTTLYAHLYKTLKDNGIQAQWGDKVNFVKTVGGYMPTLCFRDVNKIDASYYQSRMADIASRMMQVPFKDLKQYFDQTIRLEEFW